MRYCLKIEFDIELFYIFQSKSLTSNLQFDIMTVTKYVFLTKGGNDMAQIAYVRVSTVEQNEARQLEALKKYNIDKWFTEKVSGKDTNRPQLEAMLDYVREGDTVYIHDFSRLARSTKDLLAIVEQLQAKGVELVSNKENIDTSTPTGKLMLTMIGAIAEFERANLLERQREGIEIAKREHKFKGRKPVSVSKETFLAQYDRYLHREINKGEFAKILGVSRPTLDKLISLQIASGSISKESAFAKSKKEEMDDILEGRVQLVSTPILKEEEVHGRIIKTSIIE